MAVSEGNLIILDSVDSTNNYAMGLVQKGLAQHGIAVFSSAQTKGKGRRGKQWIADAGKNIFLSIIAQMQSQPLSRQFEVSAAVAMGCYDFMNRYLPNKISVKWPNDLYINDSKAGGILIENTIKGTLWQWSVIGIGLNVNQTEFIYTDKPAGSFKMCTGLDYNLFELLPLLISDIMRRLDQVSNGKFDTILEEYNEKLYAKDKAVKFQKDGQIINTVIKGVNHKGQLIAGENNEYSFNFDEVIFLGKV